MFSKWRAFACAATACLASLGAHSQEYKRDDPDFRTMRFFYLQTETSTGGARPAPAGVMRLAVSQWRRVENNTQRFDLGDKLEGAWGWLAAVGAGRVAPRDKFFPYEGTDLLFSRGASDGEVVIRQGDTRVPARNLRLAVCPSLETTATEECWVPANASEHSQSSWDRYEPRAGMDLVWLMKKSNWADNKVVIFRGVSSEPVKQTFLSEAAVAREQRTKVANEEKQVRQARSAAHDAAEKQKAEQIAATLKTSPRGKTAFCKTGDLLQPEGRLLSEMNFYCDLTGDTQPMRVKQFLESGWSLLTQNRTLMPGYGGTGYSVEVAFQKQ
jgi:hypothetical protein